MNWELFRRKGSYPNKNLSGGNEGSHEAAYWMQPLSRPIVQQHIHHPVRRQKRCRLKELVGAAAVRTVFDFCKPKLIAIVFYLCCIRRKLQSHYSLEHPMNNQQHNPVSSQTTPFQNTLNEAVRRNAYKKNRRGFLTFPKRVTSLSCYCMFKILKGSSRPHGSLGPIMVQRTLSCCFSCCRPCVGPVILQQFGAQSADSLGTGRFKVPNVQINRNQVKKSVQTQLNCIYYTELHVSTYFSSP
jgi:hypothetical protein